MVRKLTIIAVFLFRFFAIFGQSENEYHYQDEDKYHFIELSTVSVYQFIELLKIDSNDTSKVNILTIGMTASENWVSQEDIDTLIILINSTKPAKCVMQIISSYLPIGENSTIGGQVMNIIEAYKDKKLYPNALTSCAKTDEERIKKIKQWWDEQKKQD